MALVEHQGRFVDTDRLTYLTTDPRRFPGIQLAAWAEERVKLLPEEPSRELLHSELLLLQKHYVKLLRQAKPSQRKALTDAHLRAYERLEEILDTIAPPQTTKPPKPKPPRPAPAPPVGVDLGDAEW